MDTLKNILTFIKVKGYDIKEFERKAGLVEGTLNSSLEKRAELNPMEIEKIHKTFRNELMEQGYVTLELSAFGQEGLGIIYAEKDNPFEHGTDEWANWAIDNYIKKSNLKNDN